MRSARSSVPRRLLSVMGLVFIILTHHQAAAQATAPQATATTTSATTTAPKTNATQAASEEAMMWRTVSDSLAKVMTDTLAQRPLNISASDMIQSATDFLRGLGTGKNLQNMASFGQGGLLAQSTLGSGAGATMRAAGQRITNGDLVKAFDDLRATAKSLGMAMPSGSNMMDTWTKMADALRNGDIMSVMPTLMSGARVGGAMAQQADPPFPIPSDFLAAGATLANLGLDAVSNGPGALIGVTSLLLGMASGITGIVGGSLFIAGASILLGAGADTLSASELQKYQDVAYLQEFQDLAQESQWALLPAALSQNNYYLVDLATQVIDGAIRIASAAQ